MYSVMSSGIVPGVLRGVIARTKNVYLDNIEVSVLADIEPS